MPHYAALKPSALFCALAVLALTGCDNSSGNTAQTATPPTVTVVTLTPQAQAIVSELPGRTLAWRVAEVRPQVSGIVLKRVFTEGSDVVAGQTLYQLDAAPFQASADSAQAAVAQAEASARMAQVTLNRYRSLTAAQYVSRQDVDRALATAAQTRAAVDVAKAALASSRINLGRSTITAPISGRIGRSTVTEGALVQDAQSKALVTVQQLDPIYVDVTQSGGAFLHLQQAFASGQLQQKAGRAQVSIVLGDGSVYARRGSLAFSDVTVDQTTGSITLRAVVPNPDHRLLPGMFVRARLDQGTNPQALLIPQQAVTRTPRGEATTMVVGSDNKVEIRPIQVAQAAGDRWQVVSGLQAGERVIVSGVQRAQPGMVVSPQAATPASSATGARD